MGTPETIKNELCPNCGHFVTRLVEFTGWCFQCSLPVILSIDESGHTTTAAIRCIGCGGNVGDLTHTKCRNCRQQDWLNEHADEIDRCLALGASVTRAKKLVSAHANDDLKCAACGGPLRKATRGKALFCTKSECRKAYNKWRRLQQEKGLSKETALNAVLNGLKG